MPIFLGLDLSKSNSGWCYLNPKNHRDARVGSFKSNGDWETGTLDFAKKFQRLLRDQGKPDFCIIEAPIRNVMRHEKKSAAPLFPGAQQSQMTINAKTPLILNQITGAAVASLAGYGIPFGTVGAATWRKGFFAKGTKPREGMTWKDLAVKQCRILGIEISNKDQAESVGVAFFGPNSDIYRNLQLKKGY